MADLDLAIKIVLEGIDRTDDAVRSAIRGMDDLDGKVQGLAAPLASVANGILAIDATLAAFAVTLGAIAFNEAVKFEDSLFDLQKVLSDSDKPAIELNKEIKNLALTYGESSDELRRSAANFRQSSFDTEASLQLVKNALDLVITGDLQAAEASSLLIATLKGFGAPLDDNAKLFEQTDRLLLSLKAGSDSYATSTAELITGLAKISPTANQLNLSFEETEDLLIPIIEVFRSGSDAAGALQVAFGALLSPTKEARTAIEALGVTLEENGKLRNAKDIITDLAAAFVNLEGTERAAFAATVFGVEQAGRITSALEAWATQSVDVADKMGSVASVQSEVDAKLQTSTKVIDRTTTAFTELAKTVGLEYRASLTGVIGATGEFATALDRAIEGGAFDRFFAELNPQLRAVEDTVRAMAQNLPEALAGVNFDGLLDSFGNLGTALQSVFQAFFGDIDLRKVEDLQKVLQQTADAFAALVNITAGVTESFRPFFAALGEAIRLTIDLGESAQIDLGKVLGIAQQIIQFGAALAAIFAVIGLAGIDMGRVVEGVFAAVRIGANTLQVGFDTVALGINEILRTTNSAIATVVGDIARTFEQLSNEPIIGGLFSGLAESSRNLATEFAKSADDLQLRSDAIAENLDRNFSEMTAAQNDFSGALSGTNDKYTEAENRLRTLRTSTENVVTQFSAAATAATESGRATESQGKAAAQAAIETGLLARKQELAAEFARGFRIEMIDGIPTYIQVGTALAGISSATEKTSKEMREAEEASESFRLKLLEIASDERIKLIQASVDLQTADLEAGTRRIEASFQGIGETVSSTGDVLNTAFSELGELAKAGRDETSEQFLLRRRLKEQIEIENTHRDRALLSQEALNAAIVAEIRARTEALARGDALITIDTTGVEPALQLVLETIIKESQIQANAAGLEVLIGLPSV